MDVEAVVCIPTFRRPESLKKTLESLTAQTGSIRFSVVVVENDASRLEGKAVADAVLAAKALSGLCVVEAEQGNCSAINRGFRTAREQFPTVEFFLMMDDDEVASPSWVTEMVGTARTSGSDLVGGPVLRQFEEIPPRRRQRHPLFNPTMTNTGEIPSLHGTGNCLIRRRVFDALGEPSFDPRFNFLGGGDMDFFTRSRLAGFKAYWNNSAVVTEAVPNERTTIKFMLRRSICIGAINYTIDRKRFPDSKGAIGLIVKNWMTVGLALLRAANIFLRTGDWLRASYPLCLSVGRNMAAIGFVPFPYKAQRNPAPAERPVIAAAGSPERTTSQVDGSVLKSRTEQSTPFNDELNVAR